MINGSPTILSSSPFEFENGKEKKKKVDKWLLKAFPPNFPSLFNSPPYIRKNTTPPLKKKFKYQLCIKTNKFKKSNLLK
jgi:hypothetical protein